MVASEKLIYIVICFLTWFPDVLVDLLVVCVDYKSKS